MLSCVYICLNVNVYVCMCIFIQVINAGGYREPITLPQIRTNLGTYILPTLTYILPLT